MNTVAAADHANDRPLSQWLRLLWDIAPALRFDSDRPYIAAAAIHLPPSSHWRQQLAAAAHAGAHLVYSPCVVDGDGCGPIVRALIGLLEDARVEVLAARELPGLVRLWRPLHTATPALGSGFEALLARLARALADPRYDDPDSWVCKGRALFFQDYYHDKTCRLPALRTPADVRSAAICLGHDIGQMRLQFNSKTYSPQPAYRDDHRWMWPADVEHAAPPPSAAADAGGARCDEAPVHEISGTLSRYPEWDRLIGRLRADWCCVIEQPAPVALQRAAVSSDGVIQQTALRLRRPLRAMAREAGAPQRSEEGETFDPGALVDWRVARRLRSATETRLYRAPRRRRSRAAVYVLIDQSASTAAALGADGQNVLQTAAAAAGALAAALQAQGMACAVAGFSSHGRHAVRVVTVKSFDATVDDAMITRLQALRPAGSTRLGAALRHAAQCLAQHRRGARWVIVLSDGEPHDVDMHDPHYLIEDARHAVCASARNGVRVICPVLSRDDSTQARRIFGPGGVQTVQHLSELPRAISRLLG